jgi:hypothetical protein
MTCAQLADEVAAMQGDRRTPLGVSGLPSARLSDVELPSGVHFFLRVPQHASSAPGSIARFYWTMIPVSLLSEVA